MEEVLVESVRVCKEVRLDIGLDHVGEQPVDELLPRSVRNEPSCARIEDFFHFCEFQLGGSVTDKEDECSERLTQRSISSWEISKLTGFNARRASARAKTTSTCYKIER